MLRLAEGVILNLLITTYPFLPIILLWVTPTANRNSYRVARLVGMLTQGSVLRPQPWAGKTQLRQSCCCLCKPLPMPSPRGGSSFLLCLRVLCGGSFPLGKAGMGLVVGLAAATSPWGRLGWGPLPSPSPLPQFRTKKGRTLMWDTSFFIVSGHSPGKAWRLSRWR